MALPLIVGIAAKAGQGKDTLAGMLGWPTRAFAYTLKAMLSAACLPEPPTREEKEALIEGLGFSWREAAQLLGTEWGRALNPEIWILLTERALNNCGHKVVVITDVRFDNEATWVRRHGLLAHLEGRPTTTVGYAANHASEAGVAKASGDYLIRNEGSLQDLQESATRFKHHIESQWL